MRNTAKRNPEKKIVLCRVRFGQLLTRYGGVRRFANEVCSGYGTVKKAKDGIGIRTEVVLNWMKKLELELDDYLPLPDDPEDFAEAYEIKTPRRWEIARFLTSGYIEAPNGIQFRKVLLRHTKRNERLAVGMFYELLRSNLSTEARKTLIAQINRHPEIIGSCHDSRIVSFIDEVDFPCETALWVLEEYVRGNSIDPSESWQLEDAKWIGREVLQGLSALHRQDFIFRELSPDKVLVTESQVVMTDFEMAKILGPEVISVGTEWRRASDYRAPEVGIQKEINASCDLFSWARVMVAMLSENGNPKTPTGKLGVPKEVQVLLEKCLSPIPARRLANAEEAMEAWLKGFEGSRNAV